MQNDLISIVVPVYNVEKYLEKCINSVLVQSYSNIEIILVDDGSTDNSGIICDKLASSDSRIKVIHKKNGGLSDARNTGLTITKGQYISFIDSDDYVDKDFIKILYKNAKEEGADISISNFERFYEGSQPIINNSDSSFSKVVMTMDQGLSALFDDRYKYQFTTAWGKLFKKTLLEDFSFPVGRNYEDSATAHILIAKSKKIVYINRKQYFYLTRPTSITGSETYSNDDVIYAVKDRVEWFAEHGYRELERKAKVQYVFTMMGVYAYLKEGQGSNNRKKVLYDEVIEFIKCNPNIKYFGIKVFFQTHLFRFFPQLYSFIIRNK